MGNFYVNHTVANTTVEAVAKVMIGRPCIIASAENNYVVVYDAESDTQDPEVISELGEKLSRDLNTSVFAVLNHDDDILFFQLFENGEVTDEYDSCPGYFDGGDMHPSGGDATKVAEVFDVEDELAIERVLRGEYAFAVHRHQALAEALNLPSCSVGFGYKYLEDGELPEGLAEADLLRIG
jgi:hypothetical protein